MTDATTYLQKLINATQKTDTEVMALALQTGLRQMWRELILGRYLRNEITRDEAIDSVGIDWVELVERQRDAVLEDLAWALEL